MQTKRQKNITTAVDGFCFILGASFANGTCYARRNLWYGIAEFGPDYIYADTDSVKHINNQTHQDFIKQYNELCEWKLRRMCDHYGLKYEDVLLPKTIKGEQKPLGVWDHDAHYDKFKTLGAKRYMVYEDGQLNITISGVNKKTAIPWLVKKLKREVWKEHIKNNNYSIKDILQKRKVIYPKICKECFDLCFEAFEEGLIIPESATGKMTHYYIDKCYEGDLIDYQGNHYHYISPSAIYLEKASYSFDINQQYIDFLKGVFYTD